MPTDGLDRCPQCSARLADARGPHPCSECGLELDEHVRIWRSGESWARLAAIYALVGLIVGLLVGLVYRFRHEQVPNPALALILAVATPAVGLLVRRVLGGRITGRFVALTPAGILVGTRPRPYLIPWTDFERIVQRGGVPRLQRRTVPLPVPLDDIFASPAEVEEFRKELAAAVRRYGGRAAKSTDATDLAEPIP